MRRRLTVLVLAVTSLVAVAFTVPLAALIARSADASARSEAEALAQSVAGNLVRIATTQGVDALRDNVPPLPAGIGLVFPDGSTAGTVTDAGRALADAAAVQRRAVATYTTSGWELALPVLTSDGPVLVTATVDRSVLRAGVARAWGLLALLGLALVLAALGLADRLARSLTRSVARLGSAARSLAEGDLSTRVDVTEPAEFAAVADAFNRLAPRLAALVEEEREEIADLSHRLRTPLTRLRLQIERVDDPAVREALSEQLDGMEAAVDHLISEARRRPAEPTPGVTDMDGFLRSRARFWAILAEEQDRRFDIDIAVGDDCAVDVGDGELTAALDAVLGNVFDHTEESVPFSLQASVRDGAVVVTVTDAGPGFPHAIDPLARGVSGGGSSGLGLDIARRAIQRGGGEIRVGVAPGGGAAVEMVLPRRA